MYESVFTLPQDYKWKIAELVLKSLKLINYTEKLIDLFKNNIYLIYLYAISTSLIQNI